MLGYEELQLSLGSLSEIALQGTLALADGETLSFWQQTQSSRSEFSLCLDSADAVLLAHPVPVPLDSAWPALFQAPKLGSSNEPTNFKDEPASPKHEPANVKQASDTEDGGESALESPEPFKLHSVTKPPETRNNVVSFRHAMRGLLREDEAAVPVPTQDNSEPVKLEVAFTNDEDSDTPHQLLRTLRDASGGQSYESLETLFADCYLPLRQSLLDGNGPPGCAQALSSFSADFARSYARAFEALRTRGKRPTMVLDAPHLAFRLARQHAAPKHTLLLVDALRYDVGVAAEERLHLQLLGHASCVARGKLWSALPADTATQLELLARGAEGLRQLSGGVAESQVMSPASDARRARSMRVGPHHLFKLDVVQHFVNQQDGLLTAQRLAQAAADVAVSVGRFIKSQAPGTLVFVFGDHGFNADRSIEPSPELVLVPYQAWLVRSAHAESASRS
jgi:hypothetical protein